MCFSLFSVILPSSTRYTTRFEVFAFHFIVLSMYCDFAHVHSVVCRCFCSIHIIYEHYLNWMRLVCACALEIHEVTLIHWNNFCIVRMYVIITHTHTPNERRGYHKGLEDWRGNEKIWQIHIWCQLRAYEISNGITFDSCCQCMLSYTRLCASVYEWDELVVCKCQRQYIG